MGLNAVDAIVNATPFENFLASGPTMCPSLSEDESMCVRQQPETRHQERLYDAAIDVLELYITPAVCILGCVGNIFNLIVLNRGQFRRADGGKETSVHMGLKFLAVSDTLFCVCLFPRYLVPSTKGHFTEKSFALYYQAYSNGLITTFIQTSTWIMVAMATMRYLAICFPLRVRAYDGPKYARILFSIIVVLCTLVNLPTFWFFHIEELSDASSTWYILDIGAMNMKKPAGTVFLWCRAFYGMFIPTIILIFCNVSLVKALQRSYKMRRRYNVNEYISRSRSRITLMLISIVTAFIVLVLPSYLMDFFTDVITNDITKTETFILMRIVANFLQTINFAFNFAMYCVINAYFRCAVQELVTCGIFGKSQTHQAPSAVHNAGTTRWIFVTRTTSSSRKASDSLM